jgi:hypothetical protein
MSGVRRSFLLSPVASLPHAIASRSSATPRNLTVKVVLALAFGLGACGSGPSKSQALEAIQAGVKEDGTCTLPVEVLSKLKMQHVTKGMCVPKEGADKARACVDALVKANITHKMDESYMVAWPDDVAAASLKDVPAYERRPRNLVYSTCVELSGDLREGRFTCAEAHAEKVTRVTTTDPTHADVHYTREVTLRPTLAAIDAACGAVSQPPGESTVKFAKGETGAWALVPPEPAAR